MADVDLFEQINNAVLDLQAAGLQSYERPLKTLARLLHSHDLEPINQVLTRGIDLDTFLADAGKRRGGMAGSDRINWPDEQEKVLGITLLLIDRFAANPNEISNFGHTYYHSGNKIIDSIRAVVGQMIAPFTRDYKAYVLSQGNMTLKVMPALSKKVFVVHGHDEGARESVARFLERLGFEAIILHEQANQGRTVIEKIEAHGDVGFAVVLLTPDDYGGKIGEESKPRARQNVVLELGYFVGRLGRGHVCALLRGEVEIPSDFSGVVYQPMDAGGGWKGALAKELSVIGHNIDWSKVMS